MPDLFRVNNAILGWNSISSVRFAGVPKKGCLSLDYGQKRERKVVYGMDRRGKPLGRTSGKYSVSPLKIRMLEDTYDELTTQLTLLGLGSYGDAEFPINVAYVDDLIPPVVITWRDCWIAEEADAISEGTDEKCVDVTFGALSLAKNGKTLYSVVRGLSL